MAQATQRRPHVGRQGNGVRRGRWKYLKAVHQVPGYAQDKKREQVEELYDLSKDIGETTNLAAENPEKVKELKALLEAIAQGKWTDRGKWNAPEG